MSLDVYLDMPACEHCKRGPSTVFSANITHNLNTMAASADIYKACWRPDEIGATHARHLIPFLRDGIAWLEANPGTARKSNPENNWGSYDGLLRFAKKYLAACEAHPEAEVRVWK